MKRGGSRSGCTWLPARQSEGADVMRVRRIAPIDDDHRLALAPERRHVLAARQVSDAGIAFPPHLMRVAKPPHFSRQRGVADISHIPDLIPRGAAPLNIAQEVHVAWDALRQVGTQAHAHRLRLTSRDWNRNMEFLDRLLRIGSVDDYYSVLLDGAAFQRIGLAAAVRAGERDRLSVRIHDDVRLVRRAPLQVDVTDPAHVLLLAALADAAVVVGERRTRRDGECAQDSRIQSILRRPSSTSWCQHGSSSCDSGRQVPSPANSVVSGFLKAIGKADFRDDRCGKL